MTILPAFPLFGSAGRSHRDRPPARPRQCPGPPCRPNHPQPPRGQRCLPAAFQPLTTHAKAHRQPPILACCNCTCREQDDGACRKGREAGRCFSNTRFALRYGTHVDHLCFLTTQEPAGIRRPAVCRKRSPTPTILAVPPRYGARSRFLFTSSVTTQAHRHVTLPLRPRGGSRRVCPRRHRCAMDESLGESGASARPQRWGDSAVFLSGISGT